MFLLYNCYIERNCITMDGIRFHSNFCCCCCTQLLDLSQIGILSVFRHRLTLKQKKINAKHYYFMHLLRQKRKKITFYRDYVDCDDMVSRLLKKIVIDREYF